MLYFSNLMKPIIFRVSCQKLLHLLWLMPRTKIMISFLWCHILRPVLLATYELLHTTKSTRILQLDFCVFNYYTTLFFRIQRYRSIDEHTCSISTLIINQTQLPFHLFYVLIVHIPNPKLRMTETNGRIHDLKT